MILVKLDTVKVNGHAGTGVVVFRVEDDDSQVVGAYPLTLSGMATALAVAKATAALEEDFVRLDIARLRERVVDRPQGSVNDLAIKLLDTLDYFRQGGAA